MTSRASWVSQDIEMSVDKGTAVCLETFLSFLSVLEVRVLLGLIPLQNGDSQNSGVLNQVLQIPDIQSRAHVSSGQ